MPAEMLTTNLVLCNNMWTDASYEKQTDPVEMDHPRDCPSPLTTKSKEFSMFWYISALVLIVSMCDL